MTTKLILQGVNDRIVAVEYMGQDSRGRMHARTDPAKIGPWEQLEEERAGDAVAVSILGSDGIRRYMSAQPNGRIECNRTALGPWEKFFKTRVNGGYAYQSQAHGNRYLCCDLTLPYTSPDGQPGHAIVCDRPERGPWEVFRQVGGGVLERALVGPLRVVHHPQARTHSFADDAGPRRILFCSWFCALRDWKDRQPYAEWLLDTIAKVGYQGIRIFRVLGESDSSGYFAGRAVLPEWSIEALLEFAAACQARGLRLALTCGRQWGTAERLAWERRCATALGEAGQSATVVLWEGDNEYWQNAPMRDSDEQIAFYGQLFAMVRSTLSPAPLCACGAPASEDPERLYRAATHSDILEKHGMRDEDRCVKRAFTPWYWEGDPGHFGIPMWEGEPLPPLGPDAFMPSSSPGRVTAVLAMNALVGNAVTYFCGQAVRGREPIESAPGFHELPVLLANLPEDIATWGHVPGGSIWWWQGPGKQFATVADEQWGVGALTPPKLIAWSKVIGPKWTVRDGGTTPTLTGDGGGLVVGEFA